MPLVRSVMPYSSHAGCNKMKHGSAASAFYKGCFPPPVAASKLLLACRMGTLLLCPSV